MLILANQEKEKGTLRNIETINLMHTEKIELQLKKQEKQNAQLKNTIKQQQAQPQQQVQPQQQQQQPQQQEPQWTQVVRKTNTKNVDLTKAKTDNTTEIKRIAMKDRRILVPRTDAKVQK